MVSVAEFASVVAAATWAVSVTAAPTNGSKAFFTTKAGSDAFDYPYYSSDVPILKTNTKITIVSGTVCVTALPRHLFPTVSPTHNQLALEPRQWQMGRLSQRSYRHRAYRSAQQRQQDRRRALRERLDRRWRPHQDPRSRRHLRSSARQRLWAAANAIRRFPMDVQPIASSFPTDYREQPDFSRDSGVSYSSQTKNVFLTGSADIYAFDWTKDTTNGAVIVVGRRTIGMPPRASLPPLLATTRLLGTSRSQRTPHTFLPMSLFACNTTLQTMCLHGTATSRTSSTTSTPLSCKSRTVPAPYYKTGAGWGTCPARPIHA
ncbi:hypothetical protein DFJ77DRAFT_454483 [Powellomyces hirtus]|nr:hypothetical protein DFJ77DRAFT_454483 [Powellomyces hirtus]